MNLSAPKQITWIIAVLLGVLGILGNQGMVAGLVDYSPWMLILGWLLLVIATMVDGL